MILVNLPGISLWLSDFAVSLVLRTPKPTFSVTTAQCLLPDRSLAIGS